jgi:Tfp pilus assembly protein PilZ
MAGNADSFGDKDNKARKELKTMAEQEYQGAERRQVPRKRARLDVDFTLNTRLDDQGQVRLSHSWTNDIGEQGLCLSAPEAYPIGSKLLLMVHVLNQSEPMPVIAKVCWTRRLHKEQDFKVGCEFLAIAEDDKKRILEFVSALP